jgi:hypothetical protein
MDKLKLWLEITQTSPESLGDMLGVSGVSVRNWIGGLNHPGGMNIRRLHEITSIPLDDLVPKSDAAS